jgi:uncharacterized membrane protein YqjE
MTEVRPGERSLGQLVAQATSSVSTLVKSEVELAKLELKQDAKRAALGAVLFVVAGVAASLVVIMLSVALAFGLMAWGAPGGTWGAFLWVSLAYALLAAVLIALGLLRLRRMNKIQRTRSTVKADIAMLRRTSDSEAPTAVEAGRNDHALTE